MKYKDIGARRPIPKPKTETHKSRPLSVEERQQIVADWAVEVAEKALLSKLICKKRSLEKRIAARSLEERISNPPPSTHNEPEIKTPSLEGLHFRKSKYIARVKEVRPVFDTVFQRLDPLFNKLQEEDKREDDGLQARVDRDTRNKLWEMFDTLQELYENFEEDGTHWNAKKWRRLLGALKRFKRVSFESLNDRLPEICKQIVELELTFDDL